MSERRKPNAAMALTAAFFGIASIPVAAFISTGIGIALMIPSVALTYLASA